MNYRYPYPKPIEKDLFSKKSMGEPLYGLPKDVEFCKSCVVSNQRPSSSVEFKNDGKAKKNTIAFDLNKICDPCKIRKLKDSIDWEEREAELRDICDKYRKNDGNYDCLVPGSGGKDSFMTAHLLKYKYGMNPLTCTWAPHIYTDWGWKNLQAWINAGFDNVLFTPNGKVHRLVTRLAFDNLLHPFQPFILGQKNFPPKIALQYDIQLIFYGENEAEYGNSKEDSKRPKRSLDYFTSSRESEIYISGNSLEELKEIGLSSVDLESYLPIEPDKLSTKGIEVYYLGYFEKWHPQSVYYYCIENGDFQSAPERNVGTFQTYQSLDDKMDDFHFHTTFIKFGIGRATHDAAQEIRSGDLTREEGIALVGKYDGEYPKRWSDEIFEYLSIRKDIFPTYSKFFEEPIFSEKYYLDLIDNFRSPHLWYLSNKEGWKLRKTILTEYGIKGQEETAHDWQGNK